MLAQLFWAGREITMLAGVGLFSGSESGASTETSPVMKYVGDGTAKAAPLELVAAMRK